MLITVPVLRKVEGLDMVNRDLVNRDMVNRVAHSVVSVKEAVVLVLTVNLALTALILPSFPLLEPRTDRIRNAADTDLNLDLRPLLPTTPIRDRPWAKAVGQAMSLPN